MEVRGAQRVGGVGRAGGEGVRDGPECLVGAGAVLGEHRPESVHPGGDGRGSAARKRAAAVLGAGPERCEDGVQQRPEDIGPGYASGEGCGTHGRQGAGVSGGVSEECGGVTRTGDMGVGGLDGGTRGRGPSEGVPPGVGARGGGRRRTRRRRRRGAGRRPSAGAGGRRPPEGASPEAR
ncbi:hypothetical protein GCM10017752_52230 [Streptomyces roseoviridis]